MMTRKSFCLLLLVCFSVPNFLPIQLTGQEEAKKEEKKVKKKKKKKEKKPLDPMMAAMIEMNKLGPEHKELKKAVGTWDVDCTFHIPGQPPVKTKAIAKVRSVMGGRYIQENFNCKFMGMPYQGMGSVGYDKLKKKYVATWQDNFSTGIFIQHGTADAKTKVITYLGQKLQPGLKDPVKTRMVLTPIDDNKHTFVAYNTYPQGEVKVMELIYNRRIKAPKEKKSKDKAPKKKESKKKESKKKAEK